MNHCVLLQTSVHQSFVQQLRRSTRLNSIIYHFPNVVKLDPKLENKSFPLKKHPGAMVISPTQVPLDLQKALMRFVSYSGSDVKGIQKQAVELRNYLWTRRLKMEDSEVTEMRVEIEKKIRAEMPFPSTSTELEEQEKRILQQAHTRARKQTYNWQPMQYSSMEKCLQYFFARIPYELGALKQILMEIRRRDRRFQPTSLMDFGSGLGSVFWACRDVWKEAVQEYFLVDCSAEMNQLARNLISGGDPHGKMTHKNVSFRQFLPTSNERSYDVVVSAFSFMEIENEQERQRILSSLWEKTNKYLIIVENGTNAGFRLVLSLRDSILTLCTEVNKQATRQLFRENNLDSEALEDVLAAKDLVPEQKLNLIKEKAPNLSIPTLLPKGHVFAPCPHDFACPRYNSVDKTPCNFLSKYQWMDKADNEVKKSAFSYVVMRKGEKPDAARNWPRIVRDVLTPSAGCAICRLCTSKGILEEVKLTKSRTGSQLTTIGKLSRWGDLLPVQTYYAEKTTSRESGGETEYVEAESEQVHSEAEEKHALRTM